ncbi:hypothetical protein L1887_48765 [Cichorium endivia]|nr:hypothetical protein L1887_48765 [Cichorium endivia]
MQASGVFRAAAQCSRSATARRAPAMATARIQHSTYSASIWSRSASRSSSPALATAFYSSPLSRRRELLAGAVRTLHQTNALAESRKSTPPSASQPVKSVPPTIKTASTELSKQSDSETAVTDAKPTKSLTERAKELWATAKYLFKFYFNGVKQIWANRKAVQVVQQRVATGGSALTREESQLIRTHQADMRKLPLFLFILLILEEALPLVVIWAPSLLPSTCILPNQLTKIRMGDEVKRADAVKQLKESEAVKELIPVVKASSKALSLTPAHAAEDGDVLKQLSSEELAKVAKIFSLATWGGAGMVRRRLDAHMAYLREDDALMAIDTGAGAIPQHADALAKACGERGLRCSGIEHLDMFESLRTWLRYTTRHPSTRQISNASVALLPLQMYDASALSEVKSSLEAESARGLIDKTKDVLREVVEEEKKVIHRDERSKQESISKQHQR